MKKASEIRILREGGSKLSNILNKVAKAAKQGVSAKELDKIAYDSIMKIGGKPSFLNYQPEFAEKPFPNSLCVSVNETIVHGIPTENIILKQGDIVSLDLGMEYKGLFTDMAITIGIGKIEPQYRKLIQVTKEALDKGIKAAKLGNTLGDIGYAIQSHIEKKGLAVIKNLVGHGVGYLPHEDPSVFNFGYPGQGFKLEQGLVIALEPMVTFKSGEIKELKDGSFVTVNGQVACHFEHTIAITKKGPLVITQ
ncbi:MAG: type I methionyl aminopeptidase [Bacteroidales bacterium]|nr:type I methionyl aminopeptidase [Candidatus Paceibacterota bacterium]